MWSFSEHKHTHTSGNGVEHGRRYTQHLLVSIGWCSVVCVRTKLYNKCEKRQRIFMLLNVCWLSFFRVIHFQLYCHCFAHDRMYNRAHTAHTAYTHHIHVRCIPESSNGLLMMRDGLFCFILFYFVYNMLREFYICRASEHLWWQHFRSFEWSGILLNEWLILMPFASLFLWNKEIIVPNE